MKGGQDFLNNLLLFWWWDGHNGLWRTVLSRCSAWSEHFNVSTLVSIFSLGLTPTLTYEGGTPVRKRNEYFNKGLGAFFLFLNFVQAYSTWGYSPCAIGCMGDTTWYAIIAKISYSWQNNYPKLPTFTWPLTSISLQPPKPTNGAQILTREVFLHKNQSSNLLYPSEPLDFLILAFWPCGSPTNARSLWIVLSTLFHTLECDTDYLVCTLIMTE